MGRLRLYLITARVEGSTYTDEPLAFLLEVLVLLWFPVAGVRPRVLPPLVCLVGVEQGPDRGAECGFFGGILCYLAGATPWQMALLALLGGLSGVIFHKASSFWGKWLTCLAALAGLEVLLVLGHCLAGASVFAGLRIAGPELLLSAACFPLAVLLTRLKGHPRRKRKGW